jgi:hypothetical protein
MPKIAKLCSMLKYFVLGVAIIITLSLIGLRWESGRPRNDWFGERHGQIETVVTEESITEYGHLAESVRLISDSGLQVSFRVIRDAETETPLPVLMILGGHRTGMDVVELFGDVGHHSIVGVNYPYDGPDKVKGVLPIARTIPLARQAFLDTVPAISLVLDYLVLAGLWPGFRHQQTCCQRRATPRADRWSAR